MATNTRLFLAASVTIALAGSRAVAQPALTDVLARAAEWVVRFAGDATFVVADEGYDQEYRNLSGNDWRSERRTLRSEVALVPTPPDEARRGFPWVQFRDVQEVDGHRLPDHQGRLERLFLSPSDASYTQAGGLVEESARFNIGPAIRNVNVPAFPLFFLIAQNQPRFRFRWQGDDARDGTRVAVVQYEERRRPTIMRSPRGGDRPAKGTFWIDAATGRVVKSVLDVETDRQWRTLIEVDYGRDAHLDLWVPLTMHERYANGSKEQIVCTATYSNFRRFETSARMRIPR